jgi:hypothetical protein
MPESASKPLDVSSAGLARGEDGTAVAASASLEAIFREIDRYRALGQDWASDEAVPISKETSARTKDLLRRVAQAVARRGLPWRAPSVSPDPTGSINVSWEVGDRWLLLRIVPEHRRIESVTDVGMSQPQLTHVTAQGAASRVEWVLELAG